MGVKVQLEEALQRMWSGFFQRTSLVYFGVERWTCNLLAVIWVFISCVTRVPAYVLTIKVLGDCFTKKPKNKNKKELKI